MPLAAWIYICGVLVVGTLLSVFGLPLPAQPVQVWITWAVLTFLATLALLLRAVFTSKHDSDSGTTAYSPVLVILLASSVLLPPPLMALVVVVSHLVQWLKERWAKSNNLPAWYIQPFNIAVYIIAGNAARVVYDMLQGAAPVGLALLPILVALLVCVTYLVMNTILIGQVLVLARGVTWQASGVLQAENLRSDLIMLALGYSSAVLWSQSPWLIVLALAPLALIARALQVPQLKKEAQTDGKTGLANASHFAKLFAIELERATRFQRPLAVFMADLDFLRNVNNTYGHLAGDIVLSGIGRIIRETVREYDIPARFGGEEFAIILPEAPRGEAVALAERLRQTIAATPFVVPTSTMPIYVTLSIGIACFPDDAQTGTELIHAADIAVYQAKLSGRNRVVCAAELPHSVQQRDTGEPTLVYSVTAVPPDEDRGLPEEVAALIAGLMEQPGPAARVIVPFEEAVPADGAGHGPRAGHLPALRLPAPTAPAPTPEAGPAVKPPSFVLGLFVGGVIAAGLVTAALGLVLGPRPDFIALGLLVVLAAFFEFFQINIYGPATTSVSVAVILAAALISGVPGVTVVSGAIALVHYLRRRPLLYKLAFNWATYLLSGAAVVVIMGAIAVPLTVQNLLLLSLPTAAAVLVQYAINIGLVTGAITLSTGSGFLRTWGQEFQWLVGHYLVLGMLGLLQTVAYLSLGPLGAVVFVLPVVMMRYAQQQYVERTKRSMEELTQMNEALAQANHEVVTANQAIHQINDELFVTVAKILDARDPYVGGHAAQVATYAAATAQELGLPPARIQIMRQAGFLHDIGKIAISEQILHKPGRLTPEEYEYVKTHAVTGAGFLSASKALRHLAPYVRHHHERWDGTGYPDGLAAEEIPLEARILAVCDAVEAMASDRPYQHCKTPMEIVAELRRCSGSHFDPAICEAFIRIVEREGDHFVINSAREIVRRRQQARDPQRAGADKRDEFVPSWVA